MKKFYTSNSAGIKNCVRCNAAGKFSLIVEEIEGSALYRVYTKCKVCRFEMFIKNVDRKEAYKLAGNRKSVR